MNLKTKINVPALVALGTMLMWTGTLARAQPESATRHFGYERGYRDGYAFGRDAKAKGVSLDVKGEAYHDADHGYRSEFGPKEEYETGYREGYRMGSEDAYGGTTTRFEKMFAEENYTPPNDRWGGSTIAGEMGYRDGVKAGLNDLREKHSFRPTEHDQWKDGDRGYHDSLGSKDVYKQTYRKAYENGYRDAYGPPRG